MTFSPRFERIWLESKESLLNFAGKKPVTFYSAVSTLFGCTVWARNEASAGTKRISLEQLRTVLGLDSLKDAEGDVIREARLTAWANFCQRALNVAIAEINAKIDLKIALKSLERSLHGRVTALTFSIKTQAPKRR